MLNIAFHIEHCISRLTLHFMLNIAFHVEHCISYFMSMAFYLNFIDGVILRSVLFVVFFSGE